MVATDDDGRFQLSALDHLVERDAGTMALAQANPANARGQALEGDAIGGHIEPAMQVFVSGEQLLHSGISLANVFGVATQRDPSERALALAEKRANVRRHEAREVERVLYTVVECDLADVIAIVHRGHANCLEVEHGLHMHRATFCRSFTQRIVLKCVGLRGAPAFDAPARGQIAVDEIVCRGLIGHQVRTDATFLRPLDQFGQDVGRVA